MTDKELLEMAAKAAGVDGKWERQPDYIQERWYFNVPYDNQGMLTGFEWNPLTDDGQALRLAVKLNLDIMQDLASSKGNAVLHAVEVTANLEGHPEFQPWACESRAPDPYAATRLAIVKTAAEIGKAMP